MARSLSLLTLIVVASLAAQTDASGEAEFALGQRYLTGAGVPIDHAIAVQHFRAAAGLGHELAQGKMGQAYLSGDGAPKDPTEALRWFTLCAKQGNLEAELQVGKMYLGGTGVSKNQTVAAQYFKLAAEHNDPEGQFWYAALLQEDAAAPQDKTEAMRLLRLSAGRGYARSEFLLGRSFANGDGVSKDLAEAARWYRLAADHKYAPAQFALGMAYNDGIGVPSNGPESEKWLKLAAAQGHKGAQDQLHRNEELRAEMDSILKQQDEKIANLKAQRARLQSEIDQLEQRAADEGAEILKISKRLNSGSEYLTQASGVRVTEGGEIDLSDPGLEEAYDQYEKIMGKRLPHASRAEKKVTAPIAVMFMVKMREGRCSGSAAVIRSCVSGR